jgi:glycerate 2-kinase
MQVSSLLLHLPTELPAYQAFIRFYIFVVTGMKPVFALRQDAREIFNAALSGADAAKAVSRHLRVDGETIDVDGRLYPLRSYRKIFVIGAGKASAQMCRALVELIGDWFYGGIIIVKYGYAVPVKKVAIIEAGHPIPDENGLRATQQIVSLLRQTTSEDLVINLISGGGSALLCSPADGVSFHQKQEMTRALLSCGAPIGEINAIRKHISTVKGGRLARLANPSTLISLILSDVIGDSISAIASGPTAPDPSTFSECQAIFDRYKLRTEKFGSIAKLIDKGSAGKIEETPKPGNSIFENVQNAVVGSNRLAVIAAKEQAESLGYSVKVVDDLAEGEATELAAAHAAIVKEIYHSGTVPRPACVISGGEATVTVRGDGLGGRNQEFALATALEIDGLDGVVALIGGTDGSDGPTDVAGGIVDGGTVLRGEAKALDARKSLDRNDSYHYLQATDDLFVTGPTFTNVMDLRLFIID